MRNVSEREFESLRNSMKWYEVQITGLSESRGSKYYAAECGADVMVLQEWNNDFCTSTFVIPDAEIISCNGKYAIAKRTGESGYDETPPERTTQDEISLDERFAAISRSVEDAGEVEAALVDTGGPKVMPLDKPAEPKYKPLNPTKSEPIITKGRQKTDEEQPTHEKVQVARPTKTQTVPQTRIEDRPVRRPEPKPEPPVDEFAGW